MKKIIILTILLVSCNHVKVRTIGGFMGPSVYEAYADDIKVRYYNGNCCCIAKEVLERLALDANNKKFDWKMMSNEEFKDRKLREYCELITREESK